MADTTRKRGYVHVFTGDGRGKTSAALGMAVRAVGAGFRVAMIAFDKGGDFYSERRILAERFAGDIDFQPTGIARFDPDKGTFRFGVTEEDIKEAERGLDLAKEALTSGKYQMVVLDEFCSAVTTGLIDESDALKLIDSVPVGVDLVVTGRGCPGSINNRADTASDIRELAHYFRHGVKARKGIDH